MQHLKPLLAATKHSTDTSVPGTNIFYARKSLNSISTEMHFKRLTEPDASFDVKTPPLSTNETFLYWPHLKHMFQVAIFGAYLLDPAHNVSYLIFKNWEGAISFISLDKVSACPQVADDPCSGSLSIRGSSHTNSVKTALFSLDMTIFLEKILHSQYWLNSFHKTVKQE